jgi:hypothetical protein
VIVGHQRRIGGTGGGAALDLPHGVVVGFAKNSNWYIHRFFSHSHLMSSSIVRRQRGRCQAYRIVITEQPYTNQLAKLLLISHTISDTGQCQEVYCAEFYQSAHR